MPDLKDLYTIKCRVDGVAGRNGRLNQEVCKPDLANDNPSITRSPLCDLVAPLINSDPEFCAIVERLDATRNAYRGEWMPCGRLHLSPTNSLLREFRDYQRKQRTQANENN